MRRRRGYTVIELVVSLAVLSVVLMALSMLSIEFLRFDRAVRMKWFTHPDTDAVLSRMRADVIEAVAYPATFDVYVQSEKLLILRTIGPQLEAEETVWDFRDDGVAKRRRFRNAAIAEEWSASGLPDFTIAAESFADGTIGVRLLGKDEEGRVVVEQTMAPRVE